MSMQRKTGRRGANAVEFAVVAPVLIAMLFGIFESAYFFNRYLVMTTAARIGARSASIVEEGGDVGTEASEKVDEYMARVDPGATVTTTANQDLTTRTVTVTVSRANFESITGLVPLPSTMTTSFTLRMEEELD